MTHLRGSPTAKVHTGTDRLIQIPKDTFVALGHGISRVSIKTTVGRAISVKHWTSAAASGFFVLIL